MRFFNTLILSVITPCLGVVLYGDSEPLTTEQAMAAPYIYSGRLFAASSENGSQASGSGAAVGPGIVLTATHVYWTEAWGADDEELPVGASPWKAYRKWVPAASSPLSDSFDNVAAVVSLAGYDDALHEYDDNRRDSTSPFEAFNRDSLLLIFSDDEATPNGYMRAHPRAVKSGFLGSKNFYEVVGYPSAKYSGSDSRKWLMHTTTERSSLVVSKLPAVVYDAGYSYENRLYVGGDELDSFAGNSGGPVIGRSLDTEPWLIAGVYVGSSALFRAMDEELSDMINTAVAGQIDVAESRFRFVETDIVVSEGGGPVTIGVERLGSLTESAAASVQLIDITAWERIDYEHSSDLTWDAGESGVREITFTVLEDELREGTETMVLALEMDVNGVLDVPNSVVVTIEDNDLNGPLDQWTIVDEVGAVDYSEVVFAKGKFVSVGATNAIRFSPDYQDVSVTDFPGLNRLFQITYAHGLFIGCGDGPQIIVSEDAETWDIVELPTSVSLFSIQYGHGWFVAVGGIDAGPSSQGEIWVSRDARTWSKTYDEPHDRFDDVEFGNGLFLGRAGTDFFVSTDALNWEQVETEGLSGIPSDIEFGEGVFVNAGRLGGIYTSEDGVNWALARQEDEEAWYGVGYRNGYFVATGISGKLATSSDGGITWIDRIPDTQESLWHGVTAAGKMVVIGDNGLLMTSDLPEFFDFIFQPADQSVVAGDDASFTAEFISSMNISYTKQWQKDGIPIPGETGLSLVLSGATLEDVGSYQLVVSGGGVDQFSKIAELEVISSVLTPVISSASTATSHGITLEWDDVSLGENSYRIERRAVGTGTWIQVADLAANSTSFVDRFLIPDTQYEYRISAVSDDEVASQISSVVETKPATNLINLSTRGLVGANDDVMIGGFIIPEGPDMTLYIRGLGPSLQSSEIPNTISDPHLRLIQMGVQNPLELSNMDWGDSLDLQQILDTQLPPTVERESALIVTLPSGSYTTVLSNEIDEPMAVGMIEIYDLTVDCDSCRLINLSTRGPVAKGSELMIGGLIIRGVAEKQVLVRVLGPSLQEVVSALEDPFLRTVYGKNEALLIDSWEESQNPDIFAELGLPMEDPREPAEVYQMVAGSYTFLITGVDGASGIALLEIYELE
ncbi:MAG: hypothetical protein O7C75_07530 [Verrucomicrobia bacterium]|nr:hypothetical protein [Verrucomicrobiota bacterium]